MSARRYFGVCTGGKSVKKYIRILIAALIGSAAVVEYIFYSDGHTDVNATVYYTSLCLAFFLAVGLPPKGARSRGFQYFLMGSVLAISLMFVLYDNRGLRFTNGAVILLLMGFLFLERIDVKRCGVGQNGFLPEVILGYILRPFVCLADPVKEGIEVFSKKTGEGETAKKRIGIILLQIGIAILVGIPVVFILAIILMSSDPVFADWFSGFYNFFKELFSVRAIVRGILTFVLLPFSASVLFSYVNRRVFFQNFSDALGKKPLRIPGFSAVTLLVLINALYLVYAMIQSVYLFGAWAENLPGNLTYAQYARQGFFELAFISAINAFMILIAIRYTKREGRVGHTIRCLSVLLILLSFVQLFSAFRRMTLYIRAYGLSEDRFLVSSFMILLGVLFILLGIREFSEHFPLLKVSLVAGVLALILVNVCVPGRIVANYNVNRYLQGELKSLDTRYLQRLSSDSLIVLLENEKELRETGDETVTKSMDDVHEFICVYYLGEENSDYEHSDHRYDSHEVGSYREATEQSWKGFNLSKHRLMMISGKD